MVKRSTNFAKLHKFMSKIREFREIRAKSFFKVRCHTSVFYGISICF